jgi:hypothetical protein
MDIFKNMNRIERGNSFKLVSKIKTDNGEPVIEIYSENDILFLGFIRTTNDLRLKDIMKQLFCYAKLNRYTKIKLEDDAFFTEKTNKNCHYRALIYRAFLNKPSIYLDFGFKSEINVTELRSYIYNYKIKEAKEELIPFIGKLQLREQKKFKSIIEAKDKNINDLFGEYLVKLEHCEDMKFMINKLLELSSKIEKDKISNSFLNRLYEYYKLHQSLVINVSECNT